MPATEHRFTDALPGQIYLDTDIIIGHLIDTEPHHQRCVAFLTRLLESGPVTLTVSSLLWLELVHVITSARFLQRLPVHLQRRFRVRRWQDPQVRQTYVQYFLGALDALLSQFAWMEISLTPAVRLLAIQNAGAYNLKTHDAVHLASATYAGIHDLASLDESFRRVDGLELWNDRIHPP